MVMEITTRGDADAQLAGLANARRPRRFVWRKTEIRVCEGPDPPGTPLALGGWQALRESRVVFVRQKTEIRVREGPGPAPPLGIRRVRWI